METAPPLSAQRQRQPSSARPMVAFALIATVVATGGCRSFRDQTVWTEPSLALPASELVSHDRHSGGAPPASASRQVMRPIPPLGPEGQGIYLSPGSGADALSHAEAEYALAIKLSQQGSAECVDRFFQTAAHSWQAMAIAGTSHRADDLYRSSLAMLLRTAQEHGRYDPLQGITIRAPGGQTMVKASYHGFAWQAGDFNQLNLVGDYNAPGLRRGYRSDGLGVRLVVIRTRDHDETYFDRRQPFAATALLRPALGAATSGASASYTLDFYNPLRFNRVALESGARSPLAIDISAPFAWLIRQKPKRSLSGFMQPGISESQTKLVMLEPYQPGKIPLVFIHGLLSNPLTWVDLANELRADRSFNQHYQIWAFRYPTGEPFLRSAANFRSAVRRAAAECSANGSDEALGRMVLVGHSMGGLIAKLQVASSGDVLWQSVANRPLHAIVATDRQRRDLRELFYFEPLPFVRKVVFIGTPHHGSAWARRAVGRIGARMVKPSQQRVENHRSLIAANPDVFARFVRRRIPSSVDLLEPNNPLLLATARLPLADRVEVHSMIGTARTMIFGGPGDGVVSVDSARRYSSQHEGIRSERLVRAKHSELHRHPETIDQLRSILNHHE